ncbi:MAG: DUF485 domain-containing protein [Planctomycetales bacterium]|nr:DUF485 domain-containing protein [Planctomycetales bacterium]MBN8624537.1 DUF485 domain-containing protein [Planctomycetota bacterium]
MVLHDHAGHDEPHDEVTAARNARLGRNLFLVYLVFYLGYVLLTTLAPDVMKREAWSGINIAVAYGFGLIKLALILALVYAWLCRNAVGEGAAK